MSDHNLALIDKMREIMNKIYPRQVEFLSRLVQAKSSNPFTSLDSDPYTPIEFEVSRVIIEEAERYGFYYREIGYSKERPNIVISWDNKGGKKLILNTHMDTIVPPPNYSFNPYSGHIKGNRLYGVGSADAKGCIAAFLYAIVLLNEMNIDIDGKVILEFVVDEEPGAVSNYGTKYLLEKGIRGDAAIIGEPGDKHIAIGHRGSYRFKIITKGEPIHTGTIAWEKKIKGSNAILDMVRVINALEDTEHDLDLLYELKIKRGELSEDELRLFGNRKNVFTFPTIIRGGTNINVVPSYCEAYGDVRINPKISLNDLRNIILHRLSSQEVSYELIDLLYVPAVYISPKEPIVEALHKSIKAIRGIDAKRVIVGPWNDGWLFIKNGIPAICGYGPYGKGVHSRDEWVDLTSVKYTTMIICNTIINYLSTSG